MKSKIVIIGGGPSGLMLAASLDNNKYDVALYEKNNATGRKFLVAGNGGLNLTHSEPLNKFTERYFPEKFASSFLSHFNNDHLRGWFDSLGIQTCVGSSKRVFPAKRIKPIEVLNAILKKVKLNNVLIYTAHEWKGFSGKDLIFQNAGKQVIVSADIVVFALGGASWKVTGSDGGWTHYFKEKGIRINGFKPSNCAVQINWTEDFISRSDGKVLKNISLDCKSIQQAGEIVITRKGIEGGPVYALSRHIREQLEKSGYAEVLLDLKPAFSGEIIQKKLLARGNNSITDQLRKSLGISGTSIELLKALLSKEKFQDPASLALSIKQLPLIISGMAELDEAISTVGGISLEEINETYELCKMPGHYVIGEMLDWDAPTGGYLLQGAFSMGYSLSKALNAK